MEAWRLLNCHAWLLLRAGQLRALARLGHAVGAIGSDLPALLRRPLAAEKGSVDGELLPFAQGGRPHHAKT